MEWVKFSGGDKRACNLAEGTGVEDTEICLGSSMVVSWELRSVFLGVWFDFGVSCFLFISFCS